MTVHFIDTEYMEEQLTLQGRTEAETEILLGEIREALRDGIQSLGAKRITEDIIIADNIFATWIHRVYGIKMVQINLNSQIA